MAALTIVKMTLRRFAAQTSEWKNLALLPDQLEKKVVPNCYVKPFITNLMHVCVAMLV